MKFVSVKQEKKSIFNQLFYLYLQELSGYSPWIGEQLDEKGRFLHGITEQYITDPYAKPYLIYAMNQLVGFIVIAKAPRTIKGCDYCIEEFFIVKEFRGKEIARRVCRFIFGKYPGMYCVEVMKKNRHAHHFWRRLIISMGVSFHLGQIDKTLDYYRFQIKP